MDFYSIPASTRKTGHVSRLVLERIVWLELSPREQLCTWPSYFELKPVFPFAPLQVTSWAFREQHQPVLLRKPPQPRPSGIVKHLLSAGPGPGFLPCTSAPSLLRVGLASGPEEREGAAVWSSQPAGDTGTRRKGSVVRTPGGRGAHARLGGRVFLTPPPSDSRFSLRATRTSVRTLWGTRDAARLKAAETTGAHP